MNVLGKHVILRAIEREDLPILLRWSNAPDIQLCLGGWHFPSSCRDMERWFEGLEGDELNKRFAIETTRYKLIGTANLVDINWKDRNAFHGMLLGEKETRGQGYGRDTVMAIMRYAFEELGLERLDGSIIEYNEPSLKLYVGKCGWKVEGRQANWYWRKNRYWDKVLVGINRGDYFTLVDENGYWT